jgi:hypothetical protein
MQRPAKSATHMAAQGQQATLGELPEGTSSRPKAWQKAEIASDMATRSASFCSTAWASALTDSLRAVSNSADSRTEFFRHELKNEAESKSPKRTFSLGTLLRGYGLGGLSRPDGHGQVLRKGSGPSRHLGQLAPKGLSPAYSLGSLAPRLVPLANDLAKL